MFAIRPVIFTFVAASFCVTNTAAMSPGEMPEQGQPTWEKLLTLQLEDEKKCVLSGTIFVREMPGAEGVTYSGRAKCYDGREFDFSQQKPHMKFDIKACDPTVC